MASTKSGYVVRLRLDPTWVKSQTFPITLDPSIVYSPVDSTMATGFAPIGATACSGSPCPLSTLPDGSINVSPDYQGLGETRAYFEVDLSNIPPADDLEASFGLGYSYQTFPSTDIHTVTSPLGAGATGYDLAQAETTPLVATLPGGYHWYQNQVTSTDVSSMVRQWIFSGHGGDAAWALQVTPDDPNGDGLPCSLNQYNVAYVACYVNPQLGDLRRLPAATAYPGCPDLGL